jgi:hypothetical protein
MGKYGKTSYLIPTISPNEHGQAGYLVMHEFYGHYDMPNQSVNRARFS